MRILGISAFYHDSAAALIEDGKIIAAAQEERFTRKKHDARFPVNAIRCCLSEGGTGMGGVDHVVFYDKPFLKFERLVETYLAFAPRGYSSFRMAMPLWLREKLFLKDLLLKQLRRISSGEEWNEELLFSEHHLSHAASAFFPSPFDEAIVLTMDGVGEWATTSAAIGKGNTLEVRKEIHFPHSLGFLYSAFTYYTGFKVNSGEYKLMGLAPYGEPKYKDKILEHLIDDDLAAVSRSLRRAAAKAGSAADATPHGPGGFEPGGDRGNRAAPYPLAVRGNGNKKSLSGRRGCAQLRGKRQDPARRPFRPDLDPAGGGGRRGRAGRRALRLSHAARTGADRQWGRHERCVPGAGVQPERDRESPQLVRRKLRSAG